MLIPSKPFKYEVDKYWKLMRSVVRVIHIGYSIRVGLSLCDDYLDETREACSLHEEKMPMRTHGIIRWCPTYADHLTYYIQRLNRLLRRRTLTANLHMIIVPMRIPIKPEEYSTWYSALMASSPSWHNRFLVIATSESHCRIHCLLAIWYLLCI